MKIIVNGNNQSIKKDPISVTELLKENNVESIEMVSVQLNGNFLDRDDFDKILLNENDELDFLYFMGGGETNVTV